MEQLCLYKLLAKWFKDNGKLNLEPIFLIDSTEIPYVPGSFNYNSKF